MSITGIGSGLASYGLPGQQNAYNAPLSATGGLGANGSPMPGGNPMSSLYSMTGGAPTGDVMGMLTQVLSLMMTMFQTLMGGASGSAGANADSSQSPGGGPDAGSGSPYADPASGGAQQPGSCPGQTPGPSSNVPTSQSEPPAGGEGTGANPPPSASNPPSSTSNPNNAPNNPTQTNSPTSPTPSGGGGGSMPTKTGNQAMDRWDSQIAAAAKSTGLPANYIKATVWAESRGNPSDPSQNPDGQHTDEGVMQISDYTYGDVMSNQPNAPKGLKAGNPADNIMMGAWELKDKLGRANGDFHATSKAYVGTGDEGHDNTYANNVLMYMNELNNHQPLTDN